MENKILVDYLKRCNLTHQEFADIIGVTKGAVKHWVFGRREIPETVLRLMEYFEEDIRDFYVEEE